MTSAPPIRDCYARAYSAPGTIHVDRDPQYGGGLLVRGAVYDGDTYRTTSRLMSWLEAEEPSFVAQAERAVRKELSQTDLANGLTYGEPTAATAAEESSK